MTTPRTPLPTITVGTIALSFHRGAAAVVQRLLEAHGHPVATVEGSHEKLFELQAAGEVDVLVSAWLPSSHGTYLSAYRDQVRVLAPHYEPYCVWAVPPYVPREEVGEVADLAQPEVAARMTLAIDGINPGAGISRFSARMIGEYGLDQAGYTFTPGTEEGFISRVERGIANRNGSSSRCGGPSTSTVCMTCGRWPNPRDYWAPWTRPARSSAGTHSIASTPPRSTAWTPSTWVMPASRN
jgi:glycine betaine/proline transport system substrate-binding protein